MRLFHHLSLEGFSNTYVLAPDGPGEAIVIDPGSMDAELLAIIEDHRFEPAAILLTRNERHHAGGVRTFQRIYDCPVFGRQPPTDQQRSREITDTEEFRVASFDVRAIRLPGSWIDGVMYLIAGALFPGPMFSAGLISELPQGYAKALLIEGLQSVLDDLPPETFVFPAYGPPTTIRAERRTNFELRTSPEKHIPKVSYEFAPEVEL